MIDDEVTVTKTPAEMYKSLAKSSLQDKTTINETGLLQKRQTPFGANNSQ